MPKVKLNVLVNGISGKSGNMIFKQYAYGTVISKRPDRSNVTLSKKQKQANKRFREAVKFARSVAADPELQKPYASKVKKTRKSFYHVALSDYLKRKTEA